MVMSLCLISLFSKGQIECVFLDEICNSKFFIEHFLICEKEGDTILLYDKNNVIRQCISIKSCNKTVIITTDSTYKKYNAHYISNVAKNVVVLHLYYQNRNKYTLGLWQPYSNASVLVTYKKKSRGKHKLTEFSVGVF